MRQKITVFIAGVMQGSIKDDRIHLQDYRTQIREALQNKSSNIEIVDPLDLHPESMGYSKERSVEVLLDMANRAEAADIIIAYLPTASMGTAQEMVRAHDAGKVVLSISPMKKNWFLLGFSTKIFPDMGNFIEWLDTVDLEKLI